MRSDDARDLARLVPRRSAAPIGQCSFCDRDIVAPGDVLVWVDESSYHQACYQTLLARRMTDEGIRPAI